MKRYFGLCIILLFFATVLPGCQTETGPEKTISEFQTAFNAYDINGMLNCLNPAQAEMIRNLLSMEGERYKLDASTVFLLVKLGIPLLPAWSNGVITDEVLPKLELEIKNIQQENDAATVRVNGTLTSGESYVCFEKDVILVLTDGQWLIYGIQEALE